MSQDDPIDLDLDMNNVDEDERAPRFVIPDDEDEDHLNEEDLRELTRQEFDDISARRQTSGTHSIGSAVGPFGTHIKPGDNVELIDGDFLRVESIVRDIRHRQPLLRGILLKRQRRSPAIFPKRQNELYALLEVDENELLVKDPDPPIDSSLVARPIAHVIQKRDIVFTNAPFPAYSFRSQTWTSIESIEESMVLVCRHKRVIYYNLQKRRVTGAGANMFLRAEEADNGKSINDFAKKRKWLQESDLEAAADDLADTIDLTREDDSVRPAGSHSMRRSKPMSQTRSDYPEKYTYGDICCGAGGMALGAVKARFKINFMLDHCDAVMETVRCNEYFTSDGTKILCNEIWDFTQELAEQRWMRVAVLHASFPCQPYSPANTHGNEEKNQINMDAGYSIQPLLLRTRPRVVTLEQTFGLLHSRHALSFHAMLHQFHAMGYSIRYKVLRADHYGGVQPRKRLIMIASCPGEPLPAFPEPTHGDGPDLIHLTTIQDCLDRVPRRVPPHMQQHTLKHEAAYNANRPLKQCVMTNGGDGDLHPSGRRTFNMAELALCNGFEPSHKFAELPKTEIRKQIGNAVPSCLAHAVFGAVKRWLRAEDRRMADWKPEVIVIEDN